MEGAPNGHLVPVRKLVACASALLIAALSSLPLACGSLVATSADASTLEAGEGADAARSDATEPGGPFPDAARGGDTSDDARTWPTDAACDDGGLVGDAGAPFACGSATCASGSEYCGLVSAGFVPFAEPMRGCQPLPCACAPARDCACLQPLPGYCACAAENGALTVRCSLP